MYEKIEVFIVDDDGFILDSYLMDAFDINKAIDEGLNAIQQGWTERGIVLFEPRYDFELGRWVEALDEEEVAYRMSAIEEQANPPSLEDEVVQLRKELEELKSKM